MRALSSARLIRTAGGVGSGASLSTATGSSAGAAATSTASGAVDATGGGMVTERSPDATGASEADASRGFSAAPGASTMASPLTGCSSAIVSATMTGGSATGGTTGALVTGAADVSVGRIGVEAGSSTGVGVGSTAGGGAASPSAAGSRQSPASAAACRRRRASCVGSPSAATRRANRNHRPTAPTCANASACRLQRRHLFSQCSAVLAKGEVELEPQIGLEAGEVVRRRTRACCAVTAAPRMRNGHDRADRRRDAFAEGGLMHGCASIGAQCRRRERAPRRLRKPSTEREPVKTSASIGGKGARLCGLRRP